MYLLLHTMTVLEGNCVIEAQFLHLVNNSALRVDDFRLVGRRLQMRVHPSLRINRNKVNLQRMDIPNLRTLMKQNSSRIKHQVRAIQINVNTQCHTRIPPETEDSNVIKYNPQELSPATSNESTYSNVNLYTPEKLMAASNTQMTTHWLTTNRFDKYLSTFSNFSGADMLRMSREDLIQICGHADGIRLYNALHSKGITPKLTIYVCRENTSVFTAVFLSTFSNVELMNKLSSLACIAHEQVRDIYIQGPQAINVHLSNDVIEHIKPETMFILEIIPDNGSYIFLLKPIAK